MRLRYRTRAGKLESGHPLPEVAAMRYAAVALLATALPVLAIAAGSAGEGRKLVDSTKCETCHQNKVYGPVGTVYLRKDRKVTSWPKLKAQVALCNSELNLGLFPEDEEHIATFLDATYYKFPSR
jgi:cytochrome c2